MKNRLSTLVVGPEDLAAVPDTLYGQTNGSNSAGKREK